MARHLGVDPGAGHEAIVAMVSLGLGVGLAPALVLDASGLSGSVRTISPLRPLPPLSVGLCSLKSRLSSPLVRSLWDVAGQTYAAGV